MEDEDQIYIPDEEELQELGERLLDQWAFQIVQENEEAKRQSGEGLEAKQASG